MEVEVLQADLTKQSDLAVVEARLRDDMRIGVLDNNAGAAQSGGILQQSADSIERLIALNTTSLTRLAAAVVPRFAEAGAIVNIGSMVGMAPEFGMSLYGATKAFVQFLSQGLSVELAPKGVYVQAVLPAGTLTEIWERAGIDTSAMSDLMDVGELVDAALIGFDRREPVPLQSVHVIERWSALEMARLQLLCDFSGHTAVEALQPAGFHARWLVRHAAGLRAWLCGADQVAAGARLHDQSDQRAYRQGRRHEHGPAAMHGYSPSCRAAGGHLGSQDHRAGRQAVRTGVHNLRNLRSTLG